MGTYWQPIYRELSKIKNANIVNIEPYSEVYNISENNDSSSLAFHHARGYLSGYASFLDHQQKLGKLQILMKHRTRFGTTYHEPYNVIAWKNN